MFLSLIFLRFLYRTSLYLIFFIKFPSIQSLFVNFVSHIWKFAPLSRSLLITRRKIANGEKIHGYIRVIRQQNMSCLRFSRGERGKQRMEWEQYIIRSEKDHFVPSVRKEIANSMLAGIFISPSSVGCSVPGYSTWENKRYIRSTARSFPS